MKDEEYLSWGLEMFGKGDEDVRCYTVRLVVTRTEHKCMASPVSSMHLIQPGSRAFLEHAIVDGCWGSSYVCLSCIESWKLECEA